MAGSRSATSGKVRWFLVVPGVLLLGLAGAVGFLSTDQYDTQCGGIFLNPAPGTLCDGSHTAETVAVAVIGLLALGLIVVGLAGRVRGGRLALSALLIVGVWGGTVTGTAWLFHLDECGSPMLEARWTRYPEPGPLGPAYANCPSRLDTRRLQAGGLFGASLLMLGALVVLVAKAPGSGVDRERPLLPASDGAGAAPPPPSLSR
jgi:hypothetical protein